MMQDKYYMLPLYYFKRIFGVNLPEKGRPPPSQWLIDAKDRVVGSVTQPRFAGSLKPSFDLRSDGMKDDAEPFGRLEAPCCIFGGCTELCFKFKFKVSSFENETSAGDLAVIKKKKIDAQISALSKQMSEDAVYHILFQQEREVQSALVDMFCSDSKLLCCSLSIPQFFSRFSIKSLSRDEKLPVAIETSNIDSVVLSDSEHAETKDDLQYGVEESSKSSPDVNDIAAAAQAEESTSNDAGINTLPGVTSNVDEAALLSDTNDASPSLSKRLSLTEFDYLDSFEENTQVFLTPSQKLTIVSAQILADYLYFNGNTEMCKNDKDAVYCYFCYFSIFGCFTPCYICLPKQQ
jgi:hypothetical protein